MSGMETDLCSPKFVLSFFPDMIKLAIPISFESDVVLWLISEKKHCVALLILGLRTIGFPTVLSFPAAGRNPEWSSFDQVDVSNVLGDDRATKRKEPGS